MKKLLLYSSLLVLSSSLCEAQDTLVLRNGHKMVVKIISFANEITYSIPPDAQQHTIKVSKVSCIKYGDGSVNKINNAVFNPKDTIEFKVAPYILFSAGGCTPDPNGYGGSSFKADPVYSGYAFGGYSTSITGGFNFARGWEIIGQFSYMRNGIDATGFLNETAVMFIEFLVPLSAKVDIANPTAIGTYYYTNYSGLLGISGNLEGRPVSLGFSLMFGDLVTSLPTIHGVANNLYFLNLDGETHSDFDVELGVHMDINVTRHFFIRGLFDVQISSLHNAGGFEVGNIATGNTAYSGSYSGSVNYNYPSSFNIDLYISQMGLGYKF